MWAQLKEDNKSKVTLTIKVQQDDISDMRLSDSKTVQEYALQIQGYMNNFDLSVGLDSSTGSGGTIPTSKHTYYVTKGKC